MLKKILIVLLIAAIAPFNLFAQWVSVDNTLETNTPPKVTILSDNSEATVIKIDIAGFNIKDLNVEGKTYQTIDLLTEIFNTEIGTPRLPYIAKVLAIPDQAGISVDIVETGKVQVFENINVDPARLSWFEGEPETPYTEDAKVYSSSDFYPAEYAGLESPSVFRDFRITRLSVFPVRYSPAKNQLQVVSSITVRVNYGAGEVINPRTASNKAIPPSFGKLYKSLIFNYKNVLESQYNGQENGHELMLCIMPDEFELSFQTYADWKRQSGVDVHVTTFSDIGATSTNPVIVRDFIADAYHNWDVPPTYVLVVGDKNVFPTKTVSYDYSFPSEDYFVEIDGDDYFPEMMIGRFTNQGDYRMRVMITKFLKYEQDPYVADTEWFKKGICCSNNEYESQVITKRFAANVMLEDGGFTSVDTMMSDGSSSGTGCTYSIYDVLSAVNEGRSYLNYRGEGWSSGWWANCYPLSTSNVSNLGNGEKLTFVTSIGCGVAMFNAGGGNCFGEEWVQQGTLSDIRGAIAFVGPTSNTHTTYNNKIDKGIYVGMFREGLDTPGEALLRGKLYMYNVYGTDPWVEYEYRVFTVLGDPSIHIWKEVPLAINATHPTSVSVGYNQVDFNVTFASTGLPVANAQVSLTDDEIFVTGFTDSLGHITLEVTPLIADTLIATVRGGNVIPYQAEILIIQDGEHVGPCSSPVITDIGGNIDGIINPGDNANISFTLKNWGTQTSNNVVATLASADGNATILTTTAISYGNLASNDTLAGSPFQFLINTTCPVGDYITLLLHVSSLTSSWDYSYIYEVKGCELKYKNLIVKDIDSPVPNYHMDPGETDKLYLIVKNIGVDIAPNVMGVLSSNDPYITVIDSVGSFGTLDIGSLATSFDNFFEVSVDTACPVEYYAQFKIRLYTQNGVYPYETELDVEMPIGILSTTDYTGPDAYGYYAFSSDDSIFDQAPVYNWYEIDSVGTAINANSSDYTESIALPFTFQYYGNDFNEVRINTDGWIAFGSGTQIAYQNFPLPFLDNVNNMVAPFWDDLYNSNYETGEVLYFYDTTKQRFIVEYHDLAHYGDNLNPNEEAFQIVLYNPALDTIGTGDGDIVFQYKRVLVSSSVTVGIENDAQDIGLQYVYNNEYDPTASTLRNNLAIKFTTKQPSVSLSVDEENRNMLTNNSSYLNQNYPNPFSDNTWISYKIPKATHVVLNVYDISGELVKSLQNGKQTAGNYTVKWNGLNDAGKRLSSGLYFYRLQTDDFTNTRKLFILK